MGMTDVNFPLEGYKILSSPLTFARAIQLQTLTKSLPAQLRYE